MISKWVEVEPQRRTADVVGSWCRRRNISSRDVNGSSTELAAGKHITHETPIRDSRDIRLVKSSNTKGPYEEA
jgi:hypothetical protein